MSNRNEINKKVLCVLKHKENSNEIEVDFVKIKKKLKAYKTEFENLFENENNTPKYIFNYLSKHNKLNVLLNDFDYCEILDDSYQGIEKIEKRDYKSDKIKSDNSNLKKAKNKRDKNIFKKNLKYAIEDNTEDFLDKVNSKLRIPAYSINKACEKYEKNNVIIANSHRKVGWNYPEFSINNNFSFKFDTNFGYGKSSYFYTLIKYKNIDIVPFADLVLYRFSEYEEIIKYSAKHQLKHKEWYKAMNYVKDAYNLSINDEQQFYGIYIVNQLDDLVEGLNDIFNFEEREDWKFLNKEKDFVDLNESEHNIIEFKGEKITDSLGFIDILNNYKKIIPDIEKYGIDNYILKIEEINKKIKPLLSQEQQTIKDDIIHVKLKYKKLKKEINKLKKRIGKLLKRRRKYIKSCQKNNCDLGKKELNKIFKDENPTFKTFKKAQKQNIKDFSILKNLIDQYEDTLENLLEFEKAIKKYFKKKSYS